MLQGYMGCLHMAVEEVRATVLWWGVASNAKRLFSSRKPFYMYKKEGGEKVTARSTGLITSSSIIHLSLPPSLMSVFNPKRNQNT